MNVVPAGSGYKLSACVIELPGIIGNSCGFAWERTVPVKKNTRKLILLFSVVFLVGCDHATKHLAKSRLEHQSLSVISGLLDLHYTENPGMAFGVLRSVPESIRGPVLIIGRGLMILVLLILWWRLHPLDRLTHIAFAILLAGAIGNWVDRIAQGYVIDFIHLHYWPVFNLADVFITIGVVMLFLRQLRGPPLVLRT